LVVRRPKERQDVWLNSETARLAALGALHLSGTTVEGLGDAQHSVVKVHVPTLPIEGPMLPVARHHVDGLGNGSSQLDGLSFARDECLELGRPEILLRFPLPTLGRHDIARGVVVTHAELAFLGIRQVATEARDQRPDGGDRLLRKVALDDLGVERIPQLFDVVAGELPDVEGADHGEHMVADAARSSRMLLTRPCRSSSHRAA
jgi:hypothetical protein